MPSEKEQIEIFLQPGEYFVGDANYSIRTLLGSCVSVTLWHPAARIGAMSHSLLPKREGPLTQLDGRYGDEAVMLLLRELMHLGAPPSECQAKIFGGGSMFAQRSEAAATDIGRRNGEAARQLLRGLRIPIVAESLFGAGHRQIVFDVASGDVWARQVKSPSRLAPMYGV